MPGSEYTIGDVESIINATKGNQNEDDRTVAAEHGSVLGRYIQFDLGNGKVVHKDVVTVDIGPATAITHFFLGSTELIRRF